MLNYLAKKKTIIKTKALAILIAVAAAIALPQVFHFFGIASGLGPSLGAAFLPMHIPVLLAGLIAGPFVGLATGLISPVLSFGISGMPSAVMLPFMTIELACYGVVCGLLYKNKMPTIVKLLIAQIIGRLVRASAIIIAIYCFNAKGVTIEWTYNVVITGIFGIVLQLVLIPLIYYRFKGLSKK